MRVRSSWPFMGALLSAGAFGVHQLRYALAYGDGAETALAASGHGYLAMAEPLIGLALAFALAYVVWRIAGGTVKRPASRQRVAVLFALTLLAVYSGQELLEGELAVGHADGLAGVFGAGGWVAVPLAIAFGGLLSLAIRLVDAAAEAVALKGGAPRARPTITAAPSHSATVSLVAAAPPLARHLAGRAPPPLGWS